VLSYGEIRAFTGEEIAWVEGTLAQVARVVREREQQVKVLYLNPLNYLTEAGRDARDRAKALVLKDGQILSQLLESKASVIESGDTDRLARWFALANVVIDPGATRVFEEQVNYASTGHMVATVAGDTARDISNPFRWPWWIWAAGGLALILALSGRRK
jgi:hypothetical protein